METTVQTSISEASISNGIMYEIEQPKNLETVVKSPVISVSKEEPDVTAISSVTSDHNAPCNENGERRSQEQKHESTDTDSTVMIDR